MIAVDSVYLVYVFALKCVIIIKFVEDLLYFV